MLVEGIGGAKTSGDVGEARATPMVVIGIKGNRHGQGKSQTSPGLCGRETYLAHQTIVEADIAADTHATVKGNERAQAPRIGVGDTAFDDAFRLGCVVPSPVAELEFQLVQSVVEAYVNIDFLDVLADRSLTKIVHIPPRVHIELQILGDVEVQLERGMDQRLTP